ncbi:glycosyl transferase [Virgisporangium aliadipatigenens]|uniref:Glycosyl transferase n=1 Tax=Virgisporangium aliadipatigenens TaxID=741659 RepID=A0A8J3YX62_9ACTN|nr:hypothetical protein [Virgisporangium aliadipatigenens]GIJ52337.1 glycosyl transferase [Virgisporangium aliadipatigenens]
MHTLPTASEDETPEVDPPRPRNPTRWVPYLLYFLGAVFLTWKVWRDPAGQVLEDNYQDQVFFEWVLTHGANAVRHLDDPMFSELINAPYGLNLMANTSVLAWSLPLAPVTWLFGAHTTLALLLTMGLFGTAAAWYYALQKLTGSRIAAAVGGGFSGFAPAIVTHTNGHPNIAAQYVLPLIVLTVVGMRDTRRPIRRGLVLAGLVVVQCFINEELLFLTALALGLFLIAYAAARPRELAPVVPSAMKTLGTTALVAGAALAYPLGRQFFGRGAYRGLPDFVLAYGADLASYWSFARRSIAGTAETSQPLSQGPTEENTFFGWPLLIALVVLVVWLRADPVVRAVAFTAVTFAALSLGSVINLNGEPTEWGGPWQFLAHLPLFDSVVPTRLALVVTPLVGILLARAVQRMGDPVSALRAGPATAVPWIVLVAVLAPLVPTPIPVTERPKVPVFFTDGAFRDWVPKGGVLVGVPAMWQSNLHAMQWQTAADQEFAIFGGYFLAPQPGDPTRRAAYGPAYPWTMRMISEVADQGRPRLVTVDEIARARADFADMRADLVVLPAHHPRADVVRNLMDQLLPQGSLVGGMWVWQVPKG